MSKNIIDVLTIILDGLDEQKCDHIITYDVQKISSVSEYVVIATVNNTIHANSVKEKNKKAIADYLKHTDSTDIEIPKSSGEVQSGWVIQDFNSIVLHLMLPETREFYEIDQVFEKKAVVYHTSVD